MRASDLETVLAIREVITVDYLEEAKAQIREGKGEREEVYAMALTSIALTSIALVEEIRALRQGIDEIRAIYWEFPPLVPVEK